MKPCQYRKPALFRPSEQSLTQFRMVRTMQVSKTVGLSAHVETDLLSAPTSPTIMKSKMNMPGAGQLPHDARVSFAETFECLRLGPQRSWVSSDFLIAVFTKPRWTAIGWHGDHGGRSWTRKSQSSNRMISLVRQAPGPTLTLTPSLERQPWRHP